MTVHPILVDVHPGDVRSFNLCWAVDLPGPDIRVCKNEQAARDQSVFLFGDEDSAKIVLVEETDGRL